MEIKVTLTADPSLTKLIESLVSVLSPAAHANGKEKVSKMAVTNNGELKETATPVVETKAETVPVPSAKPITIEQVRAAVQAKSAGGKKDQVKSLLAEFGADKVTNLIKENYPSFLQKVEAL
jgi:hypothetical protein